MTPVFRDFYMNLYYEVWPWFDPGSRLFYGNLIAAASVALIYLVYSSRFKLKEVLSFSNLKAYWLHPSALVDYQIYIVNGLIKALLFAPVLGLSFYISKYTVKGLIYILPDYSVISPNFFQILVVTVFVFVWDDFLRFFHHYLMHKVSFLWTLHKTHHSAAVLNPITLFRIHPLESLMATFRNALSLGVASGFLMFLFLGKSSLFTLLGVNIFAFLFNLIMGNLRHSHIKLSFGIFEHIFISPKQHQIHHSNKPEHFNKNFGVALSIWDKLFGTFIKSEGQIISGFGVDGLSSTSLKEAYFPWPKFNISRINFFNLHSLLLTLILLFSYKIIKAEDICLDYLNTEEIKKERLEYFVADRFLTLAGYNVSSDVRSNIPGRFRANVQTPKYKAYKSIPAYFNTIADERLFYNLRGLKDEELFRTYLSGRLEYVENELVLIIYKISKRPPNYKSMIDSNVRFLSP